MGKPFFEVFPTLKLDKAAHDIMEQSEVERVSATKKKDFTIKLQKYMEAGTREYWLVDPDKQKVIVYLLENGPDPFLYTFKDKIPVYIFNNECVIDMEEILEEIDFLY